MFHHILKKQLFFYIIVFISFIISFIVYLNIHPENWLKRKEKKITLEDIQEKSLKSYIGLNAGNNIPKLSGKKEFEALSSNKYVTALTSNIIPTGVYRRKNWIKEKSTKKVRNSNGNLRIINTRNPLITTNTFLAIENYHEYYLIQLPDNSYILALLENNYINKIKQGKQLLLPIGIKRKISSKATHYLEKICNQYNASNQYSLYTIDDTWYNKHKSTIFFIRFGIAFGIFLVLSISMVLIIPKLPFINKHLYY